MHRAEKYNPTRDGAWPESKRDKRRQQITRCGRRTFGLWEQGEDAAGGGAQIRDPLNSNLSRALNWASRGR